jgi:hypothetical protein
LKTRESSEQNKARRGEFGTKQRGIKGKRELNNDRRREKWKKI